MEELQDAIEDAQYVSSLQESLPRPLKYFPKMSEADFNKYIEKLSIERPESLEPKGICEGALGFYFFMRYVREQGFTEDSCKAEFLLDVASFRLRLEPLIILSRKIFDNFLGKGSIGIVDEELERRPPSLVRILPSSSTSSSSSSSAALSSASFSQSISAAEGENLLSGYNDNNIGNSSGISNLPSYPVRSTSVSSSSSSSSSSPTKEMKSPFPASTSNEISESEIAFSLLLENESNEEYSGSNVNGKVVGTDFNENTNAIGIDLNCIQLVRLRRALKVFYDSEDFNKQLLQLLVTVFDELDQLVFEDLCGKYFIGFKASPHWSKYFKIMYIADGRPIKTSDFALYRVLGRGGFGLVNACKHCCTGKMYAIKAMDKKRVKLKKAESQCLTERNLLTAINSPFVVCLTYAFTTDTDLYLVLDLMVGGDLGYHLTRRGRFSDNEVLYYSARILLGVAALHKLNIIYRDLKPENVLMDDEGFTRISDLGLSCKVGRHGVSGCCGTRGYWAPEMLKRDSEGKRMRYNCRVDWFSFGCCIFEFICGYSPFRTDKARNWGDFPKVDKADKDRAIDLAIQEMEVELDPFYFTPNALDLLKKLLEKDGNKRLGANGAEEIMAHPFFAEVDWESMSTDRVRPPIKPPRDINMLTQSEIGSFKDVKSDQKVTLAKEDHELYKSWDFISNKAFQEEIVDFLSLEELVGTIRPHIATDACCSMQ